MNEKLYIIDGLTSWKKSEAFRRSLLTVSAISIVQTDTVNSIARVLYVGKDPTKYVEMAAQATGLSVRTSLKKKDYKKVDFYF